MSQFLTLRTVDEIFAHIHTFSSLPAEEVRLEALANHPVPRVLALDYAAKADLPGFDRSTMDGFAVNARDVFGATEGQPALLDCIGECEMGMAPSFALLSGQTARVWTGGMIPDGADTVVMLEYSRAAGGSMVELTRPVAPGENLIRSNEDARKGQVLLPAGTRLRPQELGLLAALGETAVPVRVRPRVAIISSGDEILPVTATPRPGQVRDINTYTLMSLVTSYGAECKSFGIVPDDEATVFATVAEALAYGHIVVLSGGSSAGQRDFTVKSFSRIEGCDIFAHGVAISPGKPIIVARKGEQSLWGMPGHAASALVCAIVFIKPLIEQLSGALPPTAIRTFAELTRPVSSAQGRRDYIRVAILPPTTEGGPLRAQPVMGKSGLISTLVQAEALIVCHETQEGLYAGQRVELIQF